jgi:hypothetical protein
MVTLDLQFNGTALPGGGPGGLNYERYQRPLIFTAASTRLRFWRSSNGSLLPFLHNRYALFLYRKPDLSDGKVIAATDVTGGAGWFDAVPADVDGSGFVRILPVDAANTAIPNPLETYPVKGCTVDVGGTAKNSPTMTVDNGTYAWTHGVQKSMWALMPKDLPLIPAPLPLREVVSPFNTNLPPSQLARVQLVMNTDAIDQDRHHRCVTRGVTVTENRQGYFPEQMFDRWPRLQIKGGERGVATFPFALTGLPGRNGKLYLHNAHAFAVVDTTGQVRILAGLEHNEATYWETPVSSAADPRITIHGNWDPAIPVDKRHPWESWGFGWDQRSLALDPSAPPIEGEQPHAVGPTGFATCRHGRVLRYRFSPTDRAAPCNVDEWITGLADPWGLVTTLRNTIIVAERGSHRISEWSMDTPNTKIRDILHTPQAAAAGGVPVAPRRFAGGVGATARQYDCCAPEGLALLDEWLYFGSLAQSEVRRINLVTGALEKGLAFPTISLSSVGSYFVNIAVSDGTFGPKGTIFCTTFFNSQHGHPEAFLPGGQKWDYTGYGYGLASGRGPGFNGGHYPTMVACAGGRLYAGDSGGGVDYFCKADAYDGPYNGAAIQRGYEGHRNSGDSLIYGPYCTTVMHPLRAGDADRLAFYRSCGR